MSTVAGRMEYIVDFNDAALLAGVPRANAAFKTLAQQQQASHAAVGTAATQSSKTVVDASQRATKALEQHGQQTKSILEMIQWRLKYTAISAVTYAGMAGIGAFTAALTAVANAGIQFNSMMEKSTIAYETMLGSSSAAYDMLGKLYALAAKSPFTFADFVTGTQRLVAYGVAGEDVIKVLTAIGDATAAVGGSNDVFTRMSFSIGQMVSQGKITAREMRELAMAGVPAWQVLAEAIGKTVAETQHLSETVGIAAEIGVPALIEGIEKRFGGMQEKMNKTWTALGSTFKDYMSQAMGYAETGFFDELKQQLSDVNDWIGELNDRAREIGFMQALKEQSPEAYEALRLIQANLQVIADIGEVIYDVYQGLFGWWTPEMKTAAAVLLEFRVGAAIIAKLIPTFMMLKSTVMGMSILKSITALVGGFRAGMTASAVATEAQNVALIRNVAAQAALAEARLAATGAMANEFAAVQTLNVGLANEFAATTRAAVSTEGLALAHAEATVASDAYAAATARAATATSGLRGGVAGAATAARGMGSAIGILSVVLAAAGVGYMLYSKHLKEIEAEQEAIIAGAQTLTTTLGGQWTDLASDVGSASEKITSFAEANAAALRELGELTAEGQRAYLLSFAVQMQLRGASAADVQGQLDRLVSAAGLSLRVPVGIDAEASAKQMNEAMATLGAQLEESAGRQWVDALKAIGTGLTLGLVDMIDANTMEPVLRGSAQAMVDSWAQALADAASQDQWGVVLEAFMAQAENPAVLTELASKFGELGGIVGLTTEKYRDLTKIMQVMADDESLPQNVRAMAMAWLLNTAAGKDNAEVMKAAMAAYDYVTILIQEATSATEEYTGWVKIEADAVKELTEAWLRELEAQYDVSAAYADALKKTRAAAEADADAKVAAIDRVRKARLAELDEQQSIYEKQRSQAQSLGDPLGEQMASDRIKALEDQKTAIEEQADAQKEAARAIKDSADEAGLTLADLSAALEDASARAAGYFADLALLPQDIAAAIRDSGLTPEQKQQLAEELVVGSEADRERAFRILREMATRRSEESAAQWATYEATMSAMAAQSGQAIVDALVGKLSAGGGLVYDAVGSYAKQVAAALNPILEALGAPLIHVISTMPAHNIPAFAGGGLFLPGQAGIQGPVGPRGLVQWAEPETGGEAFIPLAPQKRSRSVKVWQQTGRMLGVFAGGGILSPWEGMESATDMPAGLMPPTLLSVFGDRALSMAHSGNVAMQGAYELASAWMKRPSGTAAGTGFGGMVATAVAVWRALQAHDPGATFLGGRAYRPYKSDHTTGHAFDSGGSLGQMNADAAWLAMTNPNQDVKYIIHNPLGIWKPSSGWGPYTPSKSVLQYAGESAWHRDHVHVSTYDNGGLLMPGITIAYNGTGRPEPVLKFADGGFAEFTGGANPLLYTAAQAASHDELLTLYSRAAAAVKVFAAELANLAARGASADEQISALNDEIAALTAERDAARQLLEMAKAAGASDEQLSELRITCLELDSDLTGLAEKAEALARVPLERAFNFWSAAASQTQQLFDILGQSSDSLALKMGLMPTLMGQMGATYQSLLDLMASATDPESIMGYASQALAQLSSMYSTEAALLRESLDKSLEALRDAQDEWQDGWDERAQAVEDAYEAEVAALDAEEQAIRDAYDKQIKAIEEEEERLRDAWAAADRAAARSDIEGELRELIARGFYTEADVQKIKDLQKQLARARQEEARQAQLDALEAQKEALEKQKEKEISDVEALRTAAEERYEITKKALDDEAALRAAAYEQAVKDAEAAYQKENDLLVAKYADMMHEVQVAEAALLAEQADYYSAGYALGMALAEGLKKSIAEVAAAAAAVKEAAGITAPVGAASGGSSGTTSGPESKSYGWGGQVAAYGWGDEIPWLPKPERSTGDPVGIIAHRGELILTENQADWLRDMKVIKGFNRDLGPTSPTGRTVSEEHFFLHLQLESDGTKIGKETIRAIADEVVPRVEKHLGRKFDRVMWGT